MRPILAERLRSTLRVAALALPLIVTTPVFAQTSAPVRPAFPDAVLVVVQISSVEGVDATHAADAHARIRSVIEQQPGLLDSGLYANYNPKAAPQWVHVTHWNQFSDWEKLFTSKAFLQAQQELSKYVTVEAGAFKLMQ